MIKLSKQVSKNSTKIKKQKKKRKGKETHYKKVFLAGINYAKSKLIAKNKIEQIILLYVYMSIDLIKNRRVPLLSAFVSWRVYNRPQIACKPLNWTGDWTTELPRSDLTLTLTFFRNDFGFCGLWQRLLSRPRRAQLDSLRPERRWSTRIFIALSTTSSSPSQLSVQFEFQFIA